MVPFINWLYATRLSQFFQTVIWIIPAVQIVHIIVLAMIFTSMAMLDLRLLGVAAVNQSTQSLVKRFLPWVWMGLPVMLCSGLILIIAEPNRQLQNFAFYLKMSLLLIVIGLTAYLQRKINRDPSGWDSALKSKWPARVIGAISLLLWVGIIACGRLIAYT